MTTAHPAPEDGLLQARSDTAGSPAVRPPGTPEKPRFEAPVVRDEGGGTGGDGPVRQVVRPEPRFRLMALGGAEGLGGDGVHAYGGIELGVLFGRLGVVGLGQYGDGNGFRSVLLAGGPAVEVVDLGYASLVLSGGAAHYEEQIPAGYTRSITGAHGGASIRVPLRFGASLALHASVWHGTLDGEGIESPTAVTSHRFSVGIGL